MNESYSSYATAAGAAYLCMGGGVAEANDTYHGGAPDDSVEDDDDADELPSVFTPEDRGWPCSTATSNRRAPVLACETVCPSPFACS